MWQALHFGMVYSAFLGRKQAPSRVVVLLLIIMIIIIISINITILITLVIIIIMHIAIE